MTRKGLIDARRRSRTSEAIERHYDQPALDRLRDQHHRNRHRGGSPQRPMPLDPADRRGDVRHRTAEPVLRRGAAPEKLAVRPRLDAARKRRRRGRPRGRPPNRAPRPAGADAPGPRRPTIWPTNGRRPPSDVVLEDRPTTHTDAAADRGLTDRRCRRRRVEDAGLAVHPRGRGSATRPAPPRRPQIGDTRPVGPPATAGRGGVGEGPSRTGTGRRRRRGGRGGRGRCGAVARRRGGGTAGGR